MHIHNYTHTYSHTTLTHTTVIYHTHALILIHTPHNTTLTYTLLHTLYTHSTLIHTIFTFTQCECTLHSYNILSIPHTHWEIWTHQTLSLTHTHTTLHIHTQQNIKIIIKGQKEPRNHSFVPWAETEPSVGEVTEPPCLAEERCSVLLQAEAL